MSDLHFSTNWNGKLNCDYFTSIRMWNENKYFVSSVFKLYLKNRYKCDVQIVEIKKITLTQLNDWMAWLDTGYSAATTRDILRKMYKNKRFVNLDIQPFAYIMFKKIKENNEPKLF